MTRTEKKKLRAALRGIEGDDDYYYNKGVLTIAGLIGTRSTNAIFGINSPLKDSVQSAKDALAQITICT